MDDGASPELKVSAKAAVSDVPTDDAACRTGCFNKATVTAPAASSCSWEPAEAAAGRRADGARSEPMAANKGVVSGTPIAENGYCCGLGPPIGSLPASRRRP